MNCIICDDDKPKSREHIIPENIGGSVIIDSVCKCCNSKFGSEVDNKLIKNRQIYDAYHKIEKYYSLDLKFEFKDAFCHLEDGTRINASLRSNENKTLTTKLNKDLFLIDNNNTEFIVKYIKSISKKETISDSIIEKSIANYVNWHNDSKSSKEHTDEIMGFTIEKREDSVKYNNIMTSDTPLRFIAKACVEFSYLFGIENKIGNIIDLKNHALYGIQNRDLKYYQEINEDIEPIPAHIIIFEDTQFIIGLFAQVFFSVAMNWLGEISQLRFANNLITKKLIYCIEDSGRIKSTNKEFTI